MKLLIPFAELRNETNEVIKLIRANEINEINKKDYSNYPFSLHCIDCKQKVFLKNGKIKIPHFAHYSENYSHCGLSKGESELHKIAKKLLYDHPNNFTFIQECIVCSNNYKTFQLPTNILKQIEKRIEIESKQYITDVWFQEESLLKNQWFFEILHSHVVPDNKWSAFRKENYIMIEIKAKDLIQSVDSKIKINHSTLENYQCEDCKQFIKCKSCNQFTKCEDFKKFTKCEDCKRFAECEDCKLLFKKKQSNHKLCYDCFCDRMRKCDRMEKCNKIEKCDKMEKCNKCNKWFKKEIKYSSECKNCKEKEAKILDEWIPLKSKNNVLNTLNENLTKHYNTCKYFKNVFNNYLSLPKFEYKKYLIGSQLDTKYLGLEEIETITNHKNKINNLIQLFDPFQADATLRLHQKLHEYKNTFSFYTPFDLCEENNKNLQIDNQQLEKTILKTIQENHDTLKQILIELQLKFNTIYDEQIKLKIINQEGNELQKKNDYLQAYGYKLKIIYEQYITIETKILYFINYPITDPKYECFPDVFAQLETIMEKLQLFQRSSITTMERNENTHYTEEQVNELKKNNEIILKSIENMEQIEEKIKKWHLKLCIINKQRNRYKVPNGLQSTKMNNINKKRKNGYM